MLPGSPCNRVWMGLILEALLTWLLCTAGTAQAQSEPQPQGVADKAKEIKALLKERRDTLNMVADLSVALYKVGVADISRVFQVQRDALRAMLDVEEDPAARITMLRDFLKVAQAVAKIAEQRVNSRTRAQDEVLQAKALVLEVRIELLREELKAKPGK
jgi:hypothetical protein